MCSQYYSLMRPLVYTNNMGIQILSRKIYKLELSNNSVDVGG